MTFKFKSKDIYNKKGNNIFFKIYEPYFGIFYHDYLFCLRFHKKNMSQYF